MGSSAEICCPARHTRVLRKSPGKTQNYHYLLPADHVETLLNTAYRQISCNIYVFLLIADRFGITRHLPTPSQP